MADSRTSIPENPDYMLSNAIENKSVIEAEKTIQNGADLEGDVYYFHHLKGRWGSHLEHAIKVGQYEMIELLINAGADVNMANALLFAVEEKHGPRIITVTKNIVKYTYH